MIEKNTRGLSCRAGAECLPSRHTALGSILAPGIAGVILHTCDPSTLPLHITEQGVIPFPTSRSAWVAQWHPCGLSHFLVPSFVWDHVISMSLWAILGDCSHFGLRPSVCYGAPWSCVMVDPPSARVFEWYLELRVSFLPALLPLSLYWTSGYRCDESLWC